MVASASAVPARTKKKVQSIDMTSLYKSLGVKAREAGREEARKGDGVRKKKDMQISVCFFVGVCIALHFTRLT